MAAGVKSATRNLSDYKRRMLLAIRIIVMGAIQYAKAMGLHVAAVDLGQKRWRWRGNSEPKSRSMQKHRILLRKFKNKSAEPRECW